MAIQKCPGCKKESTNDCSLGNHKWSCKKIDIEASRRVHQHRQSAAKRTEARERARREREEEERQREDLRREEAQEAMQIDDPSVLATSDEGPTVDESPAVPESDTLPKRTTCLPARYRDGQFQVHKRPVPIPARFYDQLPAVPPPTTLEVRFDDIEDIEGVLDPEPRTQLSTHPSPFRTPADAFGVYRIYPGGKPVWTPDESYTISDVSNSPNMAINTLPASRSWYSPYGSSPTLIEDSTHLLHAPFPNISIFRLMSWHYGTSNTKSLGQLQSLVDNVILAPDFSQDHFIGFQATKEVKWMDMAGDHNGVFDDCWIKSSVFISLPCDGVKHTSETDAPRFEVKGVYHRRLLEVLKAGLAEPGAEKFHLFPYKSYWTPSPGKPDERIYSEAYTSDFFIEQAERVQSQLRTGPAAALVPVVIGIMIWSDATQLTSFGTASLWPIYLYFANQSKYSRAKPSCFAAHHLAYIPKLSDEIQEAYKSFFNKVATALMLTHLRREIVHAVWLLLSDDDFMHAYIHGLELEFIEKNYLFFFRFFTGSHDYPEKILLTCLKYLAQCPCPRCLLLKSKIPLLGTKSDAHSRQTLIRVDNKQLHTTIEVARQKLFQEGLSIGGAAMERILSPMSLVPTRSAFSIRLFPHGFNFYQMFVPDVLHEFELGVWKSIFTHLIRILHAYGHDTITLLNERYRNIPPFGQATIRRFHSNASAMKRLAARDFEDLLQCALPVFEGLLPAEHDRMIQKLIFELATFHAFAKMRSHTETTLNDFENSTTRLGEYVRTFQRKLCPEYDTKELPSETAARGRRQSAKAAKEGTSAVTTAPIQKGQKKFNPNTYKFHALGDYTSAIRLHGTLDSYNTQLGELKHRRAKRFYPRVKKGQHAAGISKEVSRERLIHSITQRSVGHHNVARPGLKKKQPVESLPPASPSVHHQISDATRMKINISQFLSDNRNDLAVKNFYPRLLDHILARLLNEDVGDEREYSNAERSTVVIENNCLYQHNVLRINYTTYDGQREQDTITPRTRPDVMVLAGEDEDNVADYHPYWYAHVLLIFHVKIRHVGPQAKSAESQHLNILFVRWFGHDLKKGGWKTQRLHRLRFIEGNDGEAFGFIDPSRVIRGVHLMPAFAYGTTSDLLGPSKVARPYQAVDKDWACYYVGMFADRDIFMRFRGGGVGHSSTRAATNFFKKDRHQLDLDRRKSEDIYYEPDAPQVPVEQTEAEEEEQQNGEWEDVERSDSDSDDDDGIEEREADDDELDADVDEQEALGYTAL